MNPPPPHPSYQKISSSPILQTTSLWFLNRKAAFTDSMAQKRNPHNPPFREPEAIVKSQQPRTDTEPWGGGGGGSHRDALDLAGEARRTHQMARRLRKLAKAKAMSATARGKFPPPPPAPAPARPARSTVAAAAAAAVDEDAPAPLDAVNISPPLMPPARSPLAVAGSFVRWWCVLGLVRLVSRLVSSPLVFCVSGCFALLCFANARWWIGSVDAIWEK